MAEATSLIGKTIATDTYEEVPDPSYGGTQRAQVITFTDGTTFTIIHATPDDWP